MGSGVLATHVHEASPWDAKALTMGVMYLAIRAHQIVVTGRNRVCTVYKRRSELLLMLH